MADVPMVGEIAIRVHEGEISAATVSLNSDSTENTEVNRQAQETDCLLPIHDNQIEEQENQLNRAHYRNGNPGEDNDVIPEKVLLEQISELKARGENFQFSWFKTKSYAKGFQLKKPKKEPQGLKRKYYWAVMVALLFFFHHHPAVLHHCIVWAQDKLSL
ncbi:unnamed protein product [Sphagnum troendelagicum]|uniref:Uncharacterized protein n=1 Tax=Sphagnum troendelagicum TaxID=128251 RepID=A0ABP0UCC6_9BRYO